MGTVSPSRARDVTPGLRSRSTVVDLRVPDRAGERRDERGPGAPAADGGHLCGAATATAAATGITNLVSGAAGAVAVTIVLIGIAPELVPVLILGGVPALLLSRYASRTEFAFSVDQSPRQRLRMYLQMLLINRESAKEIRAFGSSDVLTGRWTTTTNAYLAALRRPGRT